MRMRNRSVFGCTKINGLDLCLEVVQGHANHSVAVLPWGQGGTTPPKFCQGNLGLTIPHVNHLRWKLFKC